MQSVGKRQRNLAGNLFDTYGGELEQNHFKKIGYYEPERPKEPQTEPTKEEPIEEQNFDVKAQRKVKVVNKPMKNLFHYAEYE